MPDQEWEQIAAVGVDSGIIWVGDPSYTMTPDTPFAIAGNWQEFVERTFEHQQNRVARWTKPEWGDIGVAVETGDGDGVYPVYVRRRAETGQIVELRVSFEPESEPI
jgi:Protein of unknown function (DUF4241)